VDGDNIQASFDFDFEVIGRMKKTSEESMRLFCVVFDRDHVARGVVVFSVPKEYFVTEEEPMRFWEEEDI
jgi:hypothetical protein